jgi:xylulokinase
MGFYLGIDLGTSYFKAGIFDEQGNLVGLGRCCVDKQVDDGGICELAIADFWNTLHKSINQAMEKAEIAPNELVAVSYSSQANSFVLLDEMDTPLTPLILWPDERAGQVPPALKSLLENPDFLKKTGLGILPGVHSMAAKAIWFQENEPGTWGKVTSIASMSDYLTLTLTGQKVSDFSTSSMTGLLDVLGERWWDEALETLNISGKFLFSPKRTGSFVGPLIGKGAKSLGLSASTQFFLGGLDHHIVAVGAGLPNSDNVSESTGTVLACVNYRQGFYPREGINVAPGLKKGYYFQMAFNENGAMALEWYQKKFASELSIEGLLKMAEGTAPGSAGLKAFPCAYKFESLLGFQNVTNKHSHGHFVRAILESTALSLRDLAFSLDKENVSEAFIASGGGARSLLWMQIKADTLNKAFIVAECGELGCQGAALIGAMGSVQLKNEVESFEKRVRYARFIEPNPVTVEKYKLETK